MKIVLAPNEVLSTPARPVDKVDSQVLKIVDEMKKNLEEAIDPIGVGLAAPQIGKSLQIFIAKPSEKSKPQIFINPKIIRIDKPSKSFTKNRKVRESNKKEKITKLEGCLSLKDIWGTVLRSPTVRLSYLDEKGLRHTRTFKEFLATVIQHEIDHLAGILFTKRVLEQKGKLYKSRKNKKGEDIFERLQLV